jgi:hypothetical protein
MSDLVIPKKGSSVKNTSKSKPEFYETFGEFLGLV